MRTLSRLGVLLTVLAFAGCGSTRATADAYTAVEPAVRETARAERLTKEAADLVESDPTEAERLLREALAADLFFGPAHNNLGVLHLNEGRLYEAASEFEWARKLMPGHPDPRVNLAMTLESAGQVEGALSAYTAALEVYPGYLPAVQGIASLTLQDGRAEERLAGWLETVALEGETDPWRAWAREQAIRLGSK